MNGWCSCNFIFSLNSWEQYTPLRVWHMSWILWGCTLCLIFCHLHILWMVWGCTWCLISGQRYPAALPERQQACAGVPEPADGCGHLSPSACCSHPPSGTKSGCSPGPCKGEHSCTAHCTNHLHIDSSKQRRGSSVEPFLRIWRACSSPRGKGRWDVRRREDIPLPCMATQCMKYVGA